MLCFPFLLQQARFESVLIVVCQILGNESLLIISLELRLGVVSRVTMPCPPVEMRNSRSSNFVTARDPRVIS